MTLRDRLETITLGPRPAGALHVENGPDDTTRETYLWAIADLAVSIAWGRAFAEGAPIFDVTVPA